MAGPLIGVTLAAGAWSSGLPSEATAGSDDESPAVAYTQCMRHHGIDYPDPVVVDGQLDNDRLPAEFDLEAPEFVVAETACDPRRQAPAVETNVDHEALAAEMEMLLDFAACMRAEGLDFPDPILDGASISGPAGPLGDDWDSFNDAQELCENNQVSPSP